MNLEEKNINQLKEEIKEMLEKADDKSAAIIEAFEKYSEVKYQSLIQKLKTESEQAESDKEYAKTLGLRNLSKEEKDFYEKLKEANQAVTSDQIDVIPTSIIDITLANIKEKGSILSHINFAPGDVKRWYTAEKTGSYSWAKLTAAIAKAKDISATFKSIVTDLGKLYILIIVPKSIRELSLPFVDKFFTAVLEEQEELGLTAGFLNGTGVEQPIGIYKQISSVDSSTQEHKDKEVNVDIVNFSPKGLASAKKTLTNKGNRSLNKLILICNPEDRADYVDPALYNAEGRLISSFKNLEIIDTPENKKGKAALYLDNTYTMGYSGMSVKNYDQTLALDDADVLIGTGYANGRAIDDNCAYVFDVTKLEEYVEKVSVIASADASSLEV